MPYGIPKIANTEARRLILEAIGQELDKCSDFSGDGLSVYGFEVDYSLTVKLINRGEVVIALGGLKAVGDTNPNNSPEDHLPTPKAKTLTVKGRVERKKQPHSAAAISGR